MKWFKHFSDTLDDPFICDLLDEFGSDGYLVYFAALELLAEGFDPKFPGEVTQKWRYVRRKVRLSLQKVKKILNFCMENRKLIVTMRENDVTIKCVRFSKLSDEYTGRKIKEQEKSRIGILSGQYTEPIGTIEEEVEEDKEKKEIKKERKENPQPSADPFLTPEQEKHITKLAKTLETHFKRKFVWPWIVQCKKSSCRAEHVIYCLEQLWEYRKNTSNPWGYLNNIMAKEHQNANERGEIEKHKERKKEELDFVGLVKNLKPQEDV